MNPAADLIISLGKLGITLYAEDDRLKWKAPEGAITAEVLADLKANKLALLAILNKADYAYRAKAKIDQLPPEEQAGKRYEFEERAAVYEYDGGRTRIAAEKAAFHDVFGEAA